MPSTHVSLHYHVVFSTKGRRRIISDVWRNELHAYIGGIVKELDAVPEMIGGTGDHVHALISLKATHILSEVVRQIKCGSSEWTHHHGVRKFSWQPGYGAFSVSASHIPRVAQYIAEQERHHSGRSFEDEYVALLKGSSIVYDEKYLW